MSKIQWTQKTWNPIIGCSPKSSGCDNCYASKMAKRLIYMPHTSYYCYVLKDNSEFDPEKFKYIPQWNGKTHWVKDMLEKPLKRKKPTMYFVCSMGDIFHESVPFEWIWAVYGIMSKTPQHTYQILTKRPERALEFYKWMGRKIKNLGIDQITPKSDSILDCAPVCKNIWLGVSTENQEEANKRIPILLKIPAAKRFVSVEPMLEEINMCHSYENELYNYLSGEYMCVGMNDSTYLEKLDWVICGAESGPNRREMNIDWVRSLKNQCEQSKTPFFFKQMFEKGKKITTPKLDGKYYTQYPV